MLRKILPEQPAQFLDFTLTEELIEKAHKAGLKVNCWTVNTQEDGERLAAWGVDFITTNILE